MSLTTTIKSIQDIMCKDVGVDGDVQRIGQMVWLLFLKIFDDRESEAELMEGNYKSPIPEELRWRNWAADPEGMTGDGLLEFVDGKLFPTLKELNRTNQPSRANVIRDVFEDAYQYMKFDTLFGEGAKTRIKTNLLFFTKGRPTQAAADIAANGYNLDIKNPHNADTDPGPSPSELLAEFARVNEEAARILEDLKPELASALSGSQESGK